MDYSEVDDYFDRYDVDSTKYSALDPMQECANDAGMSREDYIKSQTMFGLVYLFTPEEIPYDWNGPQPEYVAWYDTWDEASVAASEAEHECPNGGLKIEIFIPAWAKAMMVDPPVVSDEEQPPF
jgi:hypothetical protein